METFLAVVSEPATVISGVGATLAFWCIKKLVRIDQKMTRIETALQRCPLLEKVPPTGNED